MIGLLLISLILSVAVYAATWKLRRRWVRVVLAVGLFSALYVFPVAVWLIVGDPAPPGARTITQEELRRAAAP